jgi:hypothetical protein
MAVRDEGDSELLPEAASRVGADPANSTRPVAGAGSGGSSPIDLGALTAVGAVIASVTYVLLNSAYLEFYESLGVRPEDVGLDRLAILGRAIGLVLIGLLIWFLALGFTIVLWLSQDTRRRLRRGLPIRFREVWLYRPERKQRTGRWKVAAPAAALCIALVLVLVAVMAATVIVGRRAESAEVGTPIGPLRVGPVLLIDINADAARVYWLDKDLPRPALFDDPWLLYLGRSDRVAVFLACGTTVIVPADKVIPEVLTTQYSRDPLRGSEVYRQAECVKLISRVKKE